MSPFSQLRQPPASPNPLIDEIAEQFRLTARRLEQSLDEESRLSTQRAQLEAQVARLSNDLRQLEKDTHESTMQADALKIRLAYSEDTIANLNQSLTWCQNKSWELMTQLQDYMATPHHRLGRAWQVLTRDKKATFKALLSWLGSCLRLRPTSLAKALPARYEVAELCETLQMLAFYARDAKRQISDLPVTTPTSMAGPTLRAARRGRPDLIVYGITNWTFRKQRPQHIVGGLVARGSRAFVTTTDLPGLGEAFPSDEKILEKMAMRPIAEDIWEFTPCAFNPLNIYRDSLRDPRDLAILGRSIALLRDRFGIGRHAGLVQLPFWGPLAAAIPGARVLYDCMDNHRDFSTNDPAMIEQEDRLLAEADAVVVSSDFLDRAAGERPRAKALIRNACEFEIFSTPPERLDPAVAELEGPVIGYYGAISDWFDAALVEAAARLRPEWNFVLIGHTFGAKIEGLKSLPNVLFTGEVPYERLTSYLYRFDVCMIPFLLTELIKATNPVKIYEYSAAGKPTVATRIPEVERLGDLVAIADTAEEFVRAAERLIAEPNPQARAERLRAFARENTWPARVESFDRVMRRHVFLKVSVVVLSYNNWPVTRDCLQSILSETTYPNFELIVVDNASDPETRRNLGATSDPRLKVQMNETNLGYAGGNNCGVALASGDFIILLNNDTVCPPDWIERLLAPFAEDPRLGMASPMTNSAGNEQMLDVFCQSNQDQRLWLREFYRLRRGRRHETDRLGFFCVAIRREVWQQIGELDAGFEVGFFEDDDYCARAGEAGWKLAIVEDAFVFHHGSASFNKLEKSDKQAIEEKNRARFEEKHARPWQPPICEYMHYGAGGPGHEARPVAIIGPCLDWNAPAARPQQIALALAETGWEVYFVTGNQKHDRYLGIRLLRPFLYAVENRGEWLDEIARKKVDLVMCFGPAARDLPARFPNARVVYDLGGRNGWAWDPADAGLTDAAAARVAAKVSITAASAELVAALPIELQGRAVVVPDGVEPEHFARPRPSMVPAALANLVQSGGPIIGVLGTIAAGIAWGWLEELARLKREWTFVFFETGPATIDTLPDVFNLRNVHLVRDCAYADLPDLLAFVEAGVVPPAGGAAGVAAGKVEARAAALSFMAAGIPAVAAGKFSDIDFEGLRQGLEKTAEAAEWIGGNLFRRQEPGFRDRSRECARRFEWRGCVKKFECTS